MMKLMNPTLQYASTVKPAATTANSFYSSYLVIISANSFTKIVEVNLIQILKLVL